MQFQVQDLLGKCSMSHATVRSLIKKSFFFFVIVWLVFAYSGGTLAAGKNNNIKEYGIVILPEEECTRVAEKLNQDIAKILSHLNNVKNYWHVTLYHGAYETKDLQQIYNKIKGLKLQPFTLNLSKIYSTADRWIDLGAEKTKYLQELHESIVHLASPFHKHPLARSKDVYKDMSNVQREQVDNYGVSGVLELYNPHMTLFYQYPPRFELQDTAKRVAASSKENMVCKASKIIIGELGYNGNIEKIVYSVEIPS
ncbi:MAG: hypothetical protein LN568_04410 [Rickettsia endosymbiont of Pseudomimeciton antennatum]|nr:hypothetical protein [Rickettsia endosymbiont of Pseudomimeciton antennatum]